MGLCLYVGESINQKISSTHQSLSWEYKTYVGPNNVNFASWNISHQLRQISFATRTDFRHYHCKWNKMSCKAADMGTMNVWITLQTTTYHFQAGGKWRTILTVLILSSESDGIWRKRNNEFFKQSRFSHLAGGVTLQVILETQNELPRSEGWATNVRIRSTTQSNRTKPAKVKTHLASEPLIWKVMEIII